MTNEHLIYCPFCKDKTEHDKVYYAYWRCVNCGKIYDVYDYDEEVKHDQIIS